MSFSRFSNRCDVYIYSDVHGGYTCCGCLLQAHGSVNVNYADQMIKHLEDHKTAGHKVPKHIAETLAKEST